MTALWRIAVDGAVRLARGGLDRPVELLAVESLDRVLAGGGASLVEVLAGASVGAVPDGAVVLPPVESQPVWASGVTYERSRTARTEESGTPDVYDLVYEAERPELFLKALPGMVRGTGEPVGIRADSTWDVPEPELVLVIDATGRIVGYTCGNDMSSRSIEGANPLYLPQAKIYRDSCAIGPCIVPVEDAPALADLTIRLTVLRAGAVAFDGTTSAGSMRRDPADLVTYLTRCLDIPAGALLMTGTGIVPDERFTLRPGDEVRIAITGLGTLTNTVRTVGDSTPSDVPSGD